MLGPGRCRRREHAAGQPSPGPAGPAPQPGGYGYPSPPVYGYGYPPPAPGYASGGWGPVAPVARTSGMAVASLCCSVAGLIFCGLPGVVGVVLGHVALHQIARSETTLEGRPIAIAGLVIGYIQVVALAGLVLLIAFG